MNYIEEQEYINAIKQLEYFQAIKEKYDWQMREERTIQEAADLERYANEVVYPLIEQAKKVKEGYLRSKEQEEKTKQGLRGLKNAYKLYKYNKEMRKREPDIIDEDGKLTFTISRRLPSYMEEKEE